jgi:hypothetical protein
MKDIGVNNERKLVWESPKLIYGVINNTQSGSTTGSSGEGNHTYSTQNVNVLS